MRARVARWVAVRRCLSVALILLCASACSSSTDQGDADLVDIDGLVYARCAPGSNPTGPCVPTGLVSGAMVSTSLNGATAITDAAGHFHLVTGFALPTNCTPYTIRITATGQPTWTGTGAWGSGNVSGQTYYLADGGPTGPIGQECH